MFHLEVQMMMHLASFYIGGFLVGLLSPGRRLVEPAVGAFLSVAIVWLISFFMPSWFYLFDLKRLFIGGAIGFALALAGAWLGERLMGNLDADDPAALGTARGRLRASMWSDERGLLVPRRGRSEDDRRG